MSKLLQNALIFIYKRSLILFIALQKIIKYYSISLLVFYEIIKFNHNHPNKISLSYKLIKLSFIQFSHLTIKLLKFKLVKQLSSTLMFLQSDSDIDEQKGEIQSNITLRFFKPKLITSLNYEQEYLLRRKKQRRNRNGKKQANTASSVSVKQQKSADHILSQSLVQEIENSFYKQVYDGNDKISGYWVKGLLEGQAEIQYQNGDYFKGYFEKGYKVEGMMIFKDQGSYEGCFYNEQFHGKGVLKLKEKVISAKWSNGVVEGSCLVQYNNSHVYYGPLKQFKKHGYGYLYFPNDTKFFGQFVDGVIKGYGEYYQKGKMKCKGLWKNGKLIQLKKQDDGEFNFEDDHISWTEIQEMVNKDGSGIATCFEMLIKNNLVDQIPAQQEKSIEKKSTKKLTNSLKKCCKFRKIDK